MGMQLQSKKMWNVCVAAERGVKRRLRLLYMYALLVSTLPTDLLSQENGTGASLRIFLPKNGSEVAQKGGIANEAEDGVDGSSTGRSTDSVLNLSTDAGS